MEPNLHSPVCRNGMVANLTLIRFKFLQLQLIIYFIISKWHLPLHYRMTFVLTILNNADLHAYSKLQNSECDANMTGGSQHYSEIFLETDVLMLMVLVLVL